MNDKNLSEMSDSEIADLVKTECAELPYKKYRVGTDSFFYYTGKEGFIEAEIIFRIKIRDYINSFKNG